MNLLLKNFLIPTQKPIKKRAYDSANYSGIPIISTVICSPHNPRCSDCKTIMDEHITYVISYYVCPECKKLVHMDSEPIGFNDADILGIHGKGIQCY